MVLKKRLKSIIAIALIASSIGLGTTLIQVNAENSDISFQNDKLKATYPSNIVGFEANGMKFTGQSFLVTDGVGNARGKATVTGSVPVAAGKMGVSASIFDSKGVILHGTFYYYNEYKTQSFSCQTKSYYGGPTYAGGGAARAVTGAQQYVTRTIPRTSQKTPFSYDEFDISDEIRKEREFMFETKNMIPALATNGKEGYISIDEYIDVNPSTPEEALAIQKIRSDDYFELINVYDTENNIIGKFKIETGQAIYE